MIVEFIEKEEAYTGDQLRALTNYLRYGLLGDSAVAWVGPCQVSFEHMVDGEDLRARSEIRADRMLHFVIELFDTQLVAAVTLQRLMSEIVLDSLRTLGVEARHLGGFSRKGDDLYWGDKKFNISIATVSPNSALIHYGLNIDNRGTPVPTIGLDELGIAPDVAAKEILERLRQEIVSIKRATYKVRWVP